MDSKQEGGELIGITDCPICKEVCFQPQLFENCKHSVCIECSPKITKCPICRKVCGKRTRSGMLEDLLERTRGEEYNRRRVIYNRENTIDGFIEWKKQSNYDIEVFNNNAIDDDTLLSILKGIFKLKWTKLVELTNLVTLCIYKTYQHLAISSLNPRTIHITYNPYICDLSNFVIQYQGEEPYELYVAIIAKK